MPQIIAAMPIENRKHFSTHSVFEFKGEPQAIDVIYLHRDKDKNNDGKRIASLAARGRVVTVTLPTKEYYDLWEGLWTALKPGLAVEFTDNEVVTLKSVDLAK